MGKISTILSIIGVISALEHYHFHITISRKGQQPHLLYLQTTLGISGAINVQGTPRPHYRGHYCNFLHSSSYNKLYTMSNINYTWSNLQTTRMK